MCADRSRPNSAIEVTPSASAWKFSTSRCLSTGNAIAATRTVVVSQHDAIEQALRLVWNASTQATQIVAIPPEAWLGAVLDPATSITP